MGFNVEDLEREIKQAKQHLSDLEGALRYAKKLEGKGSAPDSPSEEGRKKEASGISETGKIDLTEITLPIRTKPMKSTIKDEIKSLITRFEDQEFTKAIVFQLLLDRSKVKDSKSSQNRIATLIRELADEGFILVTHKGKGSDPHRYQLKSANVSVLNVAQKDSK